MTKYAIGEYDRACSLVETIGSTQDLILFDRGYGGLWFFHFLAHHGKDFVVRLNSTMFPGTNDYTEGAAGCHDLVRLLRRLVQQALGTNHFTQQLILSTMNMVLN